MESPEGELHYCKVGILVNALAQFAVSQVSDDQNQVACGD